MKLKSQLKYIIGCAIITTLSGCAAMQQMQCNTNAAYSSGMNDAQDNQHMSTNYASICDPEQQKSINNSYRKGYNTGIKNQKEDNSNNITIITPPNSKPNTGYMCITKPFDSKTCGYSCIKGSFDKVYCAKKPHDSCVKGAFNTIKCGLNCHVDKFNKAQCDIERYSKNSDKPK